MTTGVDHGPVPRRAVEFIMGKGVDTAGALRPLAALLARMWAALSALLVWQYRL